MKKLLSVLLVITLSLSFITGCVSKKEDKSQKDNTLETIMFKDSLGRQVEVPKDITSYAVTGLMAQIICFAVDPDELVGLSDEWDTASQDIIADKYLNLPVIGQLYGGSSELNKEVLMQTSPQVIIDVGEAKENIKDDLDSLTESTGIPTVFIEMDFGNYADGFTLLGELLGCEDTGKDLAQYCKNIYNRSNDMMDSIDTKPTLLYCLGDLGCNVLAKDSYHSTVIDMMSQNAAVVENPSSKGLGNEVDFEQILNWNPEYIIFESNSYYDKVSSDDKWQQLDAVKSGKYVQAPNVVYNWMGFPPSVQRYLGMMWMGSILYPDKVSYDLKHEIKEFYSRFLHTDISDKQYDQMMSKALINR